MLMKFNAWLLVLSLFVPSLPAMAQLSVPNPHPRNPMIEVGGGYEQGVESHDENFLIEVQVRPTLPWGSWGGESTTRTYKVRFEFQSAFDVNGDSLSPVPYVRATFIPLELAENTSVDERTLSYRSIGFAPISVYRDVRIGRDLSLRVNLVGVRQEYLRYVSAHVGLIAQFAADVLGYQMVRNATGAGIGTDFDGLSVAHIETGVGILFRKGRAVVVTLYGGIERDLAVGHADRVSGVALTSQQSIFAQLQISVAHRVMLFTRLSYTTVDQTGASSHADPILQIMAGVRVLF
jgi:hypothetical protein